MDAGRLSRAMWVGALGVAIVVAITIVSGRGGAGVALPEVGLISPDAAPPAPEAEGAAPISTRNVPPSIVKSATATVIHRVDDTTGRLKHTFIADRITPREEWEMEAQRPQVLLYLSQSRVVHLESESGRFTAPQNIPQSGQFSGGLVLRFFDRDGGKPARVSPDSPDLALTLKLPDGAVFDATRGEVRSAGPVHLTTPTGHAEMQGRGAYLMYNEVAGRIERLVIDDVELMRFRSADDELSPASGAKKGKRGMGEPEAPAEGREADPLFYQLDFDRNIRVRSINADDEVTETIDADALRVFFAFEKRSADEDAESAGDNPSSPVTDPVPADTAPKSGRTIEVSGGGQLVMQPGIPPAEAAGMESVYLRFVGLARPVTATLPRQMSLTAQRLDYLDTGRTVVAVGSDAHPLRLTSPDLGSLGALQMVVSLDQSAGRLIGPGFIRAADPTEEGDTDRALPGGFEVTWSNSVHFTFEPLDDEADALLREVTFLGGVKMLSHDPAFELDAHQVTAHFTPVEGESVLKLVDAVGDVRVRSQEGDAEADKLWLAFDLPTMDGDDPRPRQLKAEGRAKFASTEGGIAAKFLDVTFRDPPALPAAPDAEKKKPKEKKSQQGFAADVAMVIARGDVHLTQEDLIVRCQALDADRITGQATLVGDVSISRANGEEGPFHMNVVRLELDEKTGTIRAPGPGELTFTRAPQSDTDGDAQPLAPVTVVWSDRMSLDDAAGLIHIVGNVVATEMKSEDETHRIRAGQMTLELISQEAAENIAEKDKGNDKDRARLIDSNLSNRQVKRMTAREDVKVDAWAVDPTRAGFKLWQFMLTGPRLEYTLADELARVIGPGKIIVTDDRPQEQRESPSPEASGDPLGQLTGRGQTAFYWEKELVFDNRLKKMMLEREVEMIHKPASDQQTVIRMWADLLTADAIDRVEVIGMEMGSLKVEYVELSGNVEIEHGSEIRITADRAHYEGPGEVVTLSADKPRVVEVSNIKTPRSLRGRVIRWDLKTGRKEVLEPGT